MLTKFQCYGGRLFPRSQFLTAMAQNKILVE